jgi:hypothetical protein
MPQLTDLQKKRFTDLVTAVKQDAVALVDCKDAKTGEQVPTVCLVWTDADGMINMMPLARVVDTPSPYYGLLPPHPDGEYHE